MPLWEIIMESKDKQTMNYRVFAPNYNNAVHMAEQRIKELGWEEYGYEVIKINEIIRK